MVRAYPDTEMDIRAYEQALAVARTQERARRSPLQGFDQHWKLEGPVNIAGRINTIAIHPLDKQIIYAGSATGGVFRTRDGGMHWEAIFDEREHLSVGHIAIDTRDPDIVYVGTGDRNLPGTTIYGDGVYKSADGGDTWTHLGLAAQAIVSKILIHPDDNLRIYVATMGHPVLQNNERGLYMTTDGGDTWTQSLFVSDSAGITDIVMDPTDPETLYAASWNRVRTDRRSIVAGPDAGIYKSMDGGTTWEKLENGLPQAPRMGRIALTISTTNPQKLIARYVDEGSNLGALFLTEDAGASWSLFPSDQLPQDVMGGFGWYFGRIELNPWDDDELWLLSIDLWRARDGGQAWDQAAPPWWEYIVHADKHDIVFVAPGEVLLATDGGIYRTVDAGASWTFISSFPNIQYYRIAVNPHISLDYWGGAQDNGTLKGSHLDIHGWQRVFGGDGFQPVFHPTDPEVIYVMTQNGGIWASESGGQYFDDATNGISFSDRRNWDMPLIISSYDPEILYTGTYRVYQNFCGTFTCWMPISDDLTDGNVFGARYHTISTIAESPISPLHLYVGTSDGNVWHKEAQQDWVAVHETLPDRYVTSVRASHQTLGVVWVTHSGYRANEHFPHIHKSEDHGRTWTPVSGNLPPLAINAVLLYPEDDDVLFVATDGGVYATIDGGFYWERLGANMPFVPVFDLAYDDKERRLIAGTHGRSMLSYNVDSLLHPTSVRPVAAPVMQLSVFPNPTAGYLHVNCTPHCGSAGIFVLYHLSGAQIKQWDRVLAGQLLDVDDVLPGIYLLAWESATGRATQKVVIGR